jgi:hypothetical protein
MAVPVMAMGRRPQVLLLHKQNNGTPPQKKRKRERERELKTSMAKLRRKRSHPEIIKVKCHTKEERGNEKAK